MHKDKWFMHKKNKVKYRQMGPPFDNVCVGSTPLNGMTPEFAASFDSFINVSDRPYYFYSESKPRPDTEFYWIPIQEYDFWGFEPFFKTKKILDEKYENDENIYLHCHSGTNRSPCIAMGWLISRGYDLESAAEILTYADPKRTKTFIKIYEHNLKHKRIPEMLDRFYESMRKNKGRLEDVLTDFYRNRLVKVPIYVEIFKDNNK